MHSRWSNDLAWWEGSMRLVEVEPIPVSVGLWQFSDPPDSPALSHDRIRRSPGRPHVNLCTYIMGRVKLKIKRLENTNGRQTTYAKRKNGIMKKANELAILCDTDILLLMFSPTGKPSLCNGKHSSTEEIIAKFAQLTPQERAKRKLESLEALKKTFKKLDHDVNIQDFLGTSKKIEDLTNQRRVLQTQLSEIHNRLSYCSNPEKINSIEHLEQMGSSLRESLNQIRTCKENFGKQQPISLDSNCQFQNEMHIPFRMGVDQQFQSLSWVDDNGSQHTVLPENLNLFPPRHMDCPASSPFGNYSAYFGTTKKSEIDNARHESGMLNELSGATSLGLQTGGQYPYPLYNLNLQGNAKFQPVAEIGEEQNPLDYHADHSFEALQPGFDVTHGCWASTSQPSDVAVFNDHLYEQPK